jgi:hypothetical protein
MVAYNAQMGFVYLVKARRLSIMSVLVRGPLLEKQMVIVDIAKFLDARFVKLD